MIRDATLQDLPIIADLWARVMPSFWSADMIERSFEAKGSITLIGPEGFIMGTVLGMAEIYGIAVEPAHQGRGVGGQLLQAFTQRMDECGAPSVFLEVAETNESARRLYAAQGFYQIGRRPNYYKDVAALVLRKDKEGA